MDTGNQLFPVFFRLEKMELLIVGGGYVGLEKVNAIYKNSPNANVTLVAPEIKQEIRNIAAIHPGLELLERPYEPGDLENKDLAIAATSLHTLNRQVWEDAKRRSVLVNVADTPELCDFYMSSVVKKGDLKIAISTNGRSPTFAKRIRELLEEVIPKDIDQVIKSLHSIRERLKGDFEYKVKKMDEITSAMKNDGKNE
jgi:precorrin-2 dehydrogenase/sirohydrochlorin ferrochelatase